MLSKIGEHEKSTPSVNGLTAENNILKSQNADLHRKVNALSYLPQIIAEKEYETRQYKEKSANYEAAHLRLHRQFASSIRSSLTPAVVCPQCGYRTDDGSTSQQLSKAHIVSPVIDQRDEVVTVKLQSRGAHIPESKANDTEPDRDLPDSRPVTGSKLHCDGEVAFVLPRKSPEKSVNLVDFPSVRKSPEFTKRPVTSPDARNDSKKDGTGPRKPTDLKPAIDLKKSHLNAPEVSKKLFDKLVSENARMKQVLRKLEEQRNVDVYNFLSCLEYERVISCLREELRQAQYNAEELQHFILLQSKGKDSVVTQKLVDLHQKNAQLSRDKTANKQIADAYFDAYEKVKSQLSDLQAKVKDSESHDHSSTAGSSAKLSTTEHPNSDREKQLKDQVAQLESQLSRDQKSFIFDKGVHEQKVEDLQLKLVRLTTKFEELQERNKDLAETLQAALSERLRPTINAPESLQQVVLEKKQLSDENAVLRNDLKSALEEKQLLSIQLQTFNDDFQNFQSDYSKRGKIIHEYKQKIHDLERHCLSVKAEREARLALEQKVKHMECINRELQQNVLDPKAPASDLDSGYGSHPSYRSGKSSYQSRPDSGIESYESNPRSDAGRRSSGHMFPIDEQQYTSIGTQSRDMLHSSQPGMRSHGPSGATKGSLPTSGSLSSSASSRYSSGYCSDEPMPGMSSSSSCPYVCSRCEEEFKIFELEKFVEHKQKCEI